MRLITTLPRGAVPREVKPAGEQTLPRGAPPQETTPGGAHRSSGPASGPFAGTQRFRVCSHLGQGAMGSVYAVHDADMERHVALKTLLSLDANQLYFLKEEFRSLAGILHENLVELYELVVDDDSCFFTMEMVDGAGFSDHIHAGQGDAAPGGGLDLSSLARLVDAAEQLVLGVSALHAAYKLHRDIKPSNVMVTRGGRVVLLDFGLVTPWGPEATPLEHAELAGTLPYMSPEQTWGKPLTPAADWYSVGVLLYEALTGTLPFGSAPWRMIRDKEQWKVPPVEARAPRVPAVLSQLVLELLHPEPARRPGCRQILDALCAAKAPSQRSSSRPPPMPSAPFVGREAELSVLRAALDEVRCGRVAVVRVEGTSGVGKTELVRRFVSSLQDDAGTLVLRGRCHPQESVSYKAFDALIDALSRHLVALPDERAAALVPQHAAALLRIFPVLGRVPALAAAAGPPPTIEPQELRRHAVEAMRDLFRRLAAQRRLILWIDDLQWGDADSVLLLRELLRPDDAPPHLLLLLSYQSEDVRRSLMLEALDGVLRELPAGSARTLVVGPLEASLARELAAKLLAAARGDVDEAVSDIVADAGGLPFFIGELARHVAGARDGEAAEPPAQARLSYVMKARVERLSERERCILEIAAVAAGPLDRRVALQAAGLGEPGRPEVNRLGKAYLLRLTEVDGRTAIETYHERIRGAILEQLASERRRDCHRRIAEALEAQLSPDPEALMAHHLGAGDERSAGRYAILAAEQASEALAFERAARMYSIALELHGDDPARHRLHEKLADALVNAGHGAAAAAHFASAADALAARAADAPAVIDLRRRAAEHYLRSGHVDQGIGMLRDVLSAVGLHYPSSPRRALLSVLVLRARLHARGRRFEPLPDHQVSAQELARMDVCWSAGLGLAWIDPIRTASFQARYMLLALSVGERSRVARALSTEASQLACIGGARSSQRSREVLSIAESLVEQAGDPLASAFLLLMKGTIAFYEARWLDALTLCRSAEDVLRENCRGAAWELTTSHILSLASLAYLGRMNELRAKLPKLLQVSTERGDLLAAASLATGLPSMAWLAADQPEEARRRVDEAMALWPQTGFQAQHYFALLARCQIDLYTGDAWTAWDRISAIWPTVRATVTLRVQNFRITLRHLRARCALAAQAAGALPGGAARADGARLLRVAMEEARHLDGEGLPWADALADVVRGSVAAAAGRPREAASMLLRAADAFERIDMALYAAAARYRLGSLADDALGRSLRRRSEATMRELGVAEPRRMAAALVPFYEARPQGRRARRARITRSPLRPTTT
ncbi:serine/threonine-protein kinase [Sorangium sp. So ce1389]|uniref:serine/threonine-protein kinase n=1 Tax=Sorangium sp. So ce1389 TaxID=3133336 RepID=UPI003F63B63E